MLVANVLLGISQGLTWSTTVIMKIDLVGREAARTGDGLERVRRVRGAGRQRARDRLDCRALRPPAAAVLSRRRIRRSSDSRCRHSSSAKPVTTSRTNQRFVGTLPPDGVPTPREVFWRTTLVDANLSSVSQAGLVNNLNDGMAWGLFPLVFAAAGMNLAQVGLLAAIYPATWGVGAAGDRRAVGPHRAQAADRLGHVDPGRWHRRGRRWRTRSPGLSSVPCCSGSARRWCIPRCSPRSAMSPTRRGAHRRSASIASGVTSGMRSARCSRVSRQTRSGCTPRCGSSRR